MNVVSTEIATKVKRFLNGEIGQVLVAEGDNLAFGNKTRKLVLAGVVELTQLNAANFSTNTWG